MQINDLLRRLELGQSQITKVKNRLEKYSLLIDDSILDKTAEMIIAQKSNHTCISEVFNDIDSEIITPAVTYTIMQNLRNNTRFPLIKATNTLFSYGNNNIYFIENRNLEDVIVYIKAELSFLITKHDMNGYYSLARLSKEFPICHDDISTLLDNVRYKERKDILYFNRDDMLRWYEFKSMWTTLDPLVKDILMSSDYREYKNFIMEELKKRISKFVIITGEGYLYNFKEKSEVTKEINNIVGELRNNKHDISLHVAAKKIGIPVSVIRMRIESGNIPALEDDGNIFLSQNQIDNIMFEKMNYTGINDIVDNLVSECNSRYNSIYQNNREALISFLEDNQYLGLNYLSDGNISFEKPGKNIIYINNTDISNFSEKIKMFITLYGLSEIEKFNYLKSLKNNKVKQTSDYFLTYSRPLEIGRQLNQVFLLLKTQVKEIFECDNEDIKEIVKKLPTKASKDIFVKFLYSVKRKKKTKYNTFIHLKLNASKPVRDSYTYQQVIELAKLIFNENRIKEQCLIDKAINNSKYAELWLFASLHYVCGWRSKDMISKCGYLYLSEGTEDKPYTITDAEAIFENIKNGTITDNQYEEIGEYVFARLLISNEKPRKTQDSGPGYLQIELLQSMKSYFGRLILLCEAHNLKDGSGYMSLSRVGEYKSRINWTYFFGPESKKILNDKNFRSRMMNRSYEQAMENIARKRGESGLTSYMIAAFARSHIGHLNKLSRSTAVYLDDGNFIAESVQTVVLEMFERGILGFVPYKLLFVCYPNEFKKLDYKDKTKLIQMTGLTAAEIVTAMNGLVAVKKMSDASLQGFGNTAAEILLALHRIGNGYGVSKDGTFCRMRALGYACPYPKKTICVGCEYDLITQQGLPAIVNADKYYRNMYHKTNNPKYKVVLNTIIKPAVKDALKAYQALLSIEEEQKFLNVIKELTK